MVAHENGIRKHRSPLIPRRDARCCSKGQRAGVGKILRGRMRQIYSVAKQTRCLRRQREKK